MPTLEVYEVRNRATNVSAPQQNLVDPFEPANQFELSVFTRSPDGRQPAAVVHFTQQCQDFDPVDISLTHRDFLSTVDSVNPIPKLYVRNQFMQRPQ